MAYTEIHPIYNTLSKAFAYGRSDKKKEIKSDMEAAYAYGKRDKIEEEDVYKTVTSGINCTPETAYQVSKYFMIAAKAKNPKIILAKNGKEIIGWHCTQDFEESPEELDCRTAHEIGVKLAKKLFPDFAVTVSTHINTEHIHNHIILGAWNAAGKKHNNNNAFYAQIRKESDALCEEYGLKVLEKTKQVKLVKWKDEEGKTHFFEPTERKARIRVNEFSDPGDYRNTRAYEKSIEIKVPFKDQIKEEIDKLLPEVSSYEELLDSLRKEGFIIKDKTKSGNWRKFITFQAPGQDNGTRDYKLGDGIFYTREALTDYIKQQIVVDSEEKEENMISDKDLEHVLLDFEKDEKNPLYVYISKDTSAKRKELQRATDNDIMPQSAESGIRNKHMQYLYDCINANIKSYQILKYHKIESLDALLEKATGLYRKRKTVMEEIKKIRAVLERNNTLVSCIKKAQKLEDVIQSEEYKESSISDRKQDKELLEIYAAYIKSKGLDTNEKKANFVLKSEDFAERYNAIVNNLNSVNKQLRLLDECIFTLSRIEKEYGFHDVNRKKISEYQKNRNKARNKARYEKTDNKPKGIYVG